jgi:hypothetical protein
MSARVTFLEKQGEAIAATDGRETIKPVVTVPASAVADRGGATVVLEVRDGRVRERKVVAAGQRDGQVVIREGLAGGELLIAAPPPELADGDEVKVRGR